jgi:diguanylate cyclase (GGDEF)-like protein
MGMDDLLSIPRRDACVVGADGLALLGTALARRAEDVAEELRRLTSASETHLDDAIEETFAAAARVSTAAVARWIAGDPPEVARAAGWAATRNFGQLAAQQAAALHEVTKRCLRWRDAVTTVLLEEAVGSRCPDEVVTLALDMVRRSFDVTLVRMCEAFETERKRMHEELIRRHGELAFQATHDALTGLPNRTLILDRVRQALVRSRRAQTPVAVIFVDLDNFKYVNDTYGHGTGDRLLCAVAARLSGVVREADTLGRLGGDEFVIIADGLSLLAGPELVAQRVLDVLEAPFVIEGIGPASLTVTASLGLAAGERPSAEDLLRDADIAMYRAKWAGRGQYMLFDPEMGLASQNRLTLEMDLRDAVRERQFFLVYQPIFDIQQMRTTGVEALLRWQHPTRGVVLPDDFVPLLEDINLITTVGQMVLEHACRQGRTWHDGGHPISIAVNVSARQLDSNEFVEKVRGILIETGFAAEYLIVEITETALMRDSQASAGRLAALKALGVKIAIDDFGTGYSSLDYLRQFPVDTLKIDQSFIARMLRDPEGETLIRTLIQLGEALGIETLAEGIESSGQLAQLQAQHCNSGQGFYFARPLDQDEVESFLNAGYPTSQNGMATPARARSLAKTGTRAELLGSPATVAD